MRPWDLAAGDAIIDGLIKGGEAAEEAEKFVKGIPAKLDEEFVQIIGGTMKDMAAGKAGLAELEASVSRWQTLRDAMQGFGEDAVDDSSALLGRLLPGLRVVGGLADAAGIVGGVYTMISPPEYDHGRLRDIDRGAGLAAFAGGGIGLATGLGVDFTDLAVAGMALDFVPGVGEVLGVAAGLYLTGDYIYHHTHQIAHGFDTARHAAPMTQGVGSRAA